MSQAGLVRRTSRIFKEDGRTVIVAMDHGSFMHKPLPGLDKAADTIRKAVAGGADAFLVPAGTAVAAIDAFGDAGVILSVNTTYPAVEKQVEAALAIGADGIKCMLYPFSTNPADDLTGPVGYLAAEARKVGMPFMVEPVPGAWSGGPEMRTAETVAAGARIGAELGGTMIKTFYPGTPEGMQTVVNNTPVPVVILGGEKAGDDRELLATVKDAIDGGAHGVAMGRNIWQHENPERIVAAIVAIVHGGATVDQALKELK